MDLVYRLRAATVAEIVDQMPEEVSYSAVRSALRILRRKSLVKHRRDGPRYVYTPAAPRERAARRALRHVVETFFGGAPEAAAAALLGMAEIEIPQEIVARLAERVEEAAVGGIDSTAEADPEVAVPVSRTRHPTESGNSPSARRPVLRDGAS